MTTPAPYEQISPTAKLVVEMRRHSDVPYAEQVAVAVGSAEAMRVVLGGQPFSPGVLCWMAPMIEARYKSLSRAIERSGCQQVLELAAGFSFRGAAMASPALRYVETDLPEVHAERVRLRDQLGLPARPEWVLAAVDASRADDRARAADMLVPGEPVAIVCEGLLQYLTMPEKRELALGIRGLLDRFGGVWCTPDFEALDDALHTHYRDVQFRTIGAFLVSSTQRDLRGSAFASREDIRAFATELGFAATHAPQLDGSFELTSAARTGTTAEQLELMRASRQMWTLTRG